MTNSIQYLLQKKNLIQKELPVRFGDRKQYTSRWILGSRKIPYEVIQLWSKKLNVPIHFIANEKGYSRILNEAERIEIDEYLLEHPIPDVCIELCNSPEIIRIERDTKLKAEIRKLKKRIHEDICNVSDYKNIESMEEAIDIQESNLIFYETVLHLHNNQAIKHDEWGQVFKALSYLINNASSAQIQEEGLAYDIYAALKKQREKEELGRRQEMKDYKILFTEKKGNSNYDEE